MFYFTVIPLEKLRRKAFPTFTYAYQKKIAPFSLVKIPLRKKIVAGILWQKVPQPKFPTKKIQAILEFGFLQKNQITLAKKISDYYLAPLNETLRLFFPPQIRQNNQPRLNQLHQTAKASSDKENFPKLQPTTQQKTAIKKITSQKSGAFLIFGPASSGKTLVSWEIARQTLKKKHQILVLLPEIFLAQQEKDRWQKYLKLQEEEIFFIHSALPKTVYREKWEKVKIGQIKLIIGSRSGLFLPFANLGLIVIDEQQDSAYHQWEKAPFYDARQLSQFLAQIFSARLLHLSATPTPEIFSCPQIKKITLPRLKTSQWEIKVPNFLLVDLKKNFTRHSSPISPELKKALENTLIQKKMAFLLVPQRGFGQRISCIDCHKILKCPVCQINLTDLGENYRCLHCGYQQSSLAACPYCHSFRLKSSGLGTEKVAREIKTLFPDKRILIVDQKFFQKATTKAAGWQALKKQQIDILIGTQSIAKGFDLPFLDLVAILEAENSIGENDFRFDEKKLRLFFQLAGRVNRPQSDQQGLVLLQTFQPENPLWKNLQTLDWLAWLKKELENRKAAAYPPFTFFSKITFIATNLSQVEKKVKQLYTALDQPKQKKDYLALFFSSEKPLRQKFRWKQSLILKTAQPLNAIPSLKNFFQALIANENWLLEIDPENIF